MNLMNTVCGLNCEEDGQTGCAVRPHGKNSLLRQRKMKPVPAEFAPFQYAEVRSFYGQLKAFQHVYYYEFDDSASDFVSSSENLNRIWALCKHTMKATTLFGFFIDGWERQAYEGKDE